MSLISLAIGELRRPRQARSHRPLGFRPEHARPYASRSAETAVQAACLSISVNLAGSLLPVLRPAFKSDGSRLRDEVRFVAKFGHSVCHFIKYPTITAISRTDAIPNRCLSKYALNSRRRERTLGIRTSVLGKRFNNRVAVAARSDRLHHADGILPKNRLKASAAPALGNVDKRAASTHGSEPQRAKAEIMVSVAPLSPVPISANRKFSSLASNWLISYFSIGFDQRTESAAGA
jgi:hypothetical protein